MVSVPFASQNSVRENEKKVDELFRLWSVRYPSKTPRHILAMVAYQFASHYSDLKAEYDEALNTAMETETRLDRILKGLPAQDDGDAPQPGAPDSFPGDFTDF